MAYPGPETLTLLVLPDGGGDSFEVAIKAGQDTDNQHLDPANWELLREGAVNNTVYGNDGLESTFAGTGIVEPNDTLGQAVLTRQGAAPLPETLALGIAGQAPSGRSAVFPPLLG